MPRALPVEMKLENGIPYIKDSAQFGGDPEELYINLGGCNRNVERLLSTNLQLGHQ